MNPTPTNAYMDGHIDITPGYSGGQPHIKGRRIKVRHIVVWHERMGMTLDEIADEYDLELADIHAALAYYFDHREEIDQAIIEGDSFAEEMRKSSPSLLREKLAALAEWPTK